MPVEGDRERREDASLEYRKPKEDAHLWTTRLYLGMYEFTLGHSPGMSRILVCIAFAYPVCDRRHQLTHVAYVGRVYRASETKESSSFFCNLVLRTAASQCEKKRRCSLLTSVESAPIPSPQVYGTVLNERGQETGLAPF